MSDVSINQLTHVLTVLDHPEWAEDLLNGHAASKRVALPDVDSDPMFGEPLSARSYDGPFTPPPADVLTGAIGWRFTKTSNGPNRWRPTGWEIVYPDHILTVDYSTHLATRDSILWAP